MEIVVYIGEDPISDAVYEEVVEAAKIASRITGKTLRVLPLVNSGSNVTYLKIHDYPPIIIEDIPSLSELIELFVRLSLPERSVGYRYVKETKKAITS